MGGNTLPSPKRFLANGYYYVVKSRLFPSQQHGHEAEKFESVYWIGLHGMAGPFSNAKLGICGFS